MTTHLIRQQYLHIAYNGSDPTALALKSRISDLCHHYLLPALESTLDRYSPANGRLCIDRLEVDAGTLELGRLEKDLADTIAQALDKSLRDQLDSDATSRQATPQQSLDEAFLHFLKTGTLPRSFSLPTGCDLEQVLVGSWLVSGTAQMGPRDLPAAVLAGLVSATARQRLVGQFSPSFLKKMLAMYSPQGVQSVTDVLEAIGSPVVPEAERERFQRSIWEAAFAGVVTGKPLTEEYLVGEARNAVLGTTGGDDQPATEVGPGIQVENAGLVLLHPFLPEFFETIGIAARDELLQPDRALCLLHYLSSGQLTTPEYRTMLPKVLCNVDVSTPVPSNVGLTAGEQEEAKKLLKRVIGRWEVQLDSSVDRFRGTFLLRRGELSLRADGDWLLQVEPEQCDTLLERLPWGLYLIKLPWMERMLFVEWR